jgi:putative phosphoribosyl transferase
MLRRSFYLEIPEVTLSADLSVPPEAKGVVIFSHGSGSGRKSARNIFVAETLQKRNLATLLFDLLTEEEDKVYANRFDIPLLTKRLFDVAKWTKEQPFAELLPIGFFGASTGAASALRAAALLDNLVSAVVSRGGRPDLASDLLSKVKAPVLLIVGNLDTEVIRLNQQALQQLKSPKELKLVDGASHVFEEPGKLEIAAEMAGEWFEKYLTPG